MSNYYELLDLAPGASETDIKARLKERKRIWTQRQNAPRPEQQQEATNNLRLVPEIEATLLNEQKRAAYDQKLRTTPKEASKIDVDAIDVENLIKEGWRLLSVGNVADALMVATRATGLQGDNPDAWALLGYSKAQWGDVDDAIYEYKRAISLRPNDASFYFDLGGIYEEREQWKDAMQQYQRAAQIDPIKSVYRAAMGSVYIKNEMYQEGISLLEKCAQEEPDNEGYKFLLATAHAESAYQNWTYVERIDGYLTTNFLHVEEAQRHIDKAKAVGSSDAAITARIKDLQATVDDATKRRFHGNIFAVIGAGVMGLVCLFNGAIGSGFYFLLFGGLYFHSCMTPQYKLNKRIIDGKDETSAGIMLDGFKEDGIGGGCISVFIGLIFILMLLPIMTLWNYIKNYANK